MNPDSSRLPLVAGIAPIISLCLAIVAGVLLHGSDAMVRPRPGSEPVGLSSGPGLSRADLAQASAGVDHRLSPPPTQDQDPIPTRPTDGDLPVEIAVAAGDEPVWFWDLETRRWYPGELWSAVQMLPRKNGGPTAKACESSARIPTTDSAGKPGQPGSLVPLNPSAIASR